MAEGLFDDDARALRAAGRGQLLHHLGKQRRRNGQVVHRPLCRAEGLAQRREGGRIAVVAVHVAQQRQ